MQKKSRLKSIDKKITNEKIIQILKTGGIIAYPTEGVYGLGCDPFNKDAVKKLLHIKKRQMAKGLILIAASWQQILPLIKLENIKPTILKKIRANWPGPITWIFPSTKIVPKWITGKHNSVAIRITSHPTAKKICQKFGGPIVSTSANLAGNSPIITKKALIAQFSSLNQKIIITKGRVGRLKHPTKIYDALTGKILRK